MKLTFKDLNAVFDTGILAVNSLVIENGPLFRTLLQDVVEQIEGRAGDSVLSLDNRPIDIAKNLEILDRFVPFEINKKTLLNKIMSSLEKTAMNEEHFENTQRLLSEIEMWADNIAFSELCDIICTKISVSTLIRSIGIELRDDYAGLGEKLLDYMELVREYDREKLFLAVNLHSYFSPDEMELFLRSVISKGFHVFLLDSADSYKADCERRVIVDEDLCEI